MRTPKNPINIAPFVDVLLVLFVILVVAARFDGPGKDEIAKLNMIIIDQKNKIALLSAKPTDKPSLPKTRTIEKIVASPAKVITETKVIEDTSKISQLQDRVSQLESELVKAKQNNSAMTRGGTGKAKIIFDVNDVVSVNGVQVNEEFVYSLVKVTHPDFTVAWKGAGGEAAYKFKQFASREGYSYE